VFRLLKKINDTLELVVYGSCHKENTKKILSHYSYFEAGEADDDKILKVSVLFWSL